MITILAVAWAGPMPAGAPVRPVLDNPTFDWVAFVLFAVLLAVAAWWADRPPRGEADDE